MNHIFLKNSYSIPVITRRKIETLSIDRALESTMINRLASLQADTFAGWIAHRPFDPLYQPSLNKPNDGITASKLQT